MANHTRGRCKIEVLGLVDEALRLKGEGLGSIRMARSLSAISGEKVNSTNVDNFFKSLKEVTINNKVLAESVDKQIKEVNLKLLSNWDKLDTEIMDLLDEAKAVQKKCVGIDKKTNEPVIIDFKDLRLWKDVLGEIANISEIRLRTLGQIQQGGKHITFNFIENQYNEFKQILLQAEESFPGLNNYFEEKLLSKADTETQA